MERWGSTLPDAERRGLWGRAARASRAALLAVGLALGALPAAALNAQTSGPARAGPVRVDAVEVELIAARQAVRPGEAVDLALRIRHDPHWHTYWQNPGDSGLATQIAPQGPNGTRFDPIRWPAPVRLWVGPLANYGYEDEVALPFAAWLPAVGTGSRVRFEAAVQWLMCKDVCIPGEARLALELPVVAADAAVPPPSAHAPLFEAMARRTPDPAAALEGTAHRDALTLSIAFAAPAGRGGLAQAEFFPYPEGVVAVPAPQALSRTADGWRIDLALADGAELPPVLEGLLMADGEPFTLRAAMTPVPAPVGTPVSVAQRPAASARSGSGLLAGLGLGPRPVSPSAPEASRSDPTGSAGWALALLFGAIGGVLLNLMPCVFPVVGLKVLGFAQAAGDPAHARRAMRIGAGAFAAGVVVSFWLLAALMLLLRAGGEAIGWGFQLQSPAFVAAMALLFVAVGLNFSGVFEIGLAFTRLGGLGGHSGSGAFGAGVLAVLVATPCTAPFMGSALGFTLSQPPLFTMAVFTAIGLGMALPYVLLGLFPGWVRRLPRPGRWMETLRQALAFPMYATAAWLAWVLGQQAGVDAMLRLLLAAVALGLAAWAWGRYMNGAPRRPGRALALTAASIVAGALVLVPALDPLAQGGGVPVAQGPGAAAPEAVPGSAANWQRWSEASVSQAVAEGRPVFVDFTAAWCVSCQANKKLVLERAAVVDAFRQKGVVALRADWTQRDPAITEALARHGRNGVPLYLVYRPGEAQPRVLPELLTVSIVLDALRER